MRLELVYNAVRTVVPSVVEQGEEKSSKLLIAVNEQCNLQFVSK